MKRLRKAAYIIGLAVVALSTFQCSSSRGITQSSKKSIPFKVKTISFQEWNAGENKENAGINIYVPIVRKADDIIIDSVYFRNFKGKLVRNYSRYTAVLWSNSLKYTFENSDEENDYPFTLANNECAIRYIENGKVKYLKLTDVIQKEAIYYEDGPPLAYQRRREAIVSGQESNIKPIPQFQPSTTFKVKTISYQEWYAGIKVGGTGLNVFVPIVNKEEHIKIDSVYFRNLKAKLVEKHGRYTAVLKNKSPYYTFKKTEKDDDFPFTLGDNECAISYVENGETKYLKVVDMSEKAGTYYENGPPSIYDYNSSTLLASTDKEIEDTITLGNNEPENNRVQKEEVKDLKQTDIIQKEAIDYKDSTPSEHQKTPEVTIVSRKDIKLKPIPKFQPTTTFKVKPIAYQEWYAGIKVGGTGLNVFVPIVNKEEHIKIDSVYFRNLKAKLVEKHGRYTAVLKNKSPYYTFKKTEKDDDFPFTLGDNECAISYVENGEIKYIKVTDMNEKAGTYYENGPPSIYDNTLSTAIAAIEKDGG